MNAKVTLSRGGGKIEVEYSFQNGQDVMPYPVAKLFAHNLNEWDKEVVELKVTDQVVNWMKNFLIAAGEQYLAEQKAEAERKATFDPITGTTPEPPKDDDIPF